jgi:hypothetical protein
MTTMMMVLVLVEKKKVSKVLCVCGVRLCLCAVRMRGVSKLFYIFITFTRDGVYLLRHIYG